MPLPALALPAIGAGINFLTGIFGAKKQSDAAKDAARLQAQAAQQAMAMMQQVYSPYVTAGGQSMNTLARLMTPGVPYSAPMQAADAARFWPQQPVGAPTMAVPRGFSPLGRVMAGPGY